MTLTDLTARVRFFIDEPTEQNFKTSDIVIALNIAQQDVAKEIVHEYEDYFEVQAQLNPTGGGTIPGQSNYTLPLDFLKFKRVERTDTGETIHPRDQNEESRVTYTNMQLVASTTAPGYYVMGNTFVVTPIPQSVIPITMTYVQRLVDMVNPTDVSAIPSEHHDMMAVRAAIDMFIKDESDTSALERRWNQLFDQLQRTLRERQLQEPKRVRRVVEHGLLY